MKNSSAICDRCGAATAYRDGYAFFCSAEIKSNPPLLPGQGAGESETVGACLLCHTCAKQVVTPFNFKRIPDRTAFHGNFEDDGWKLQFEMVRDAGIVATCVELGLSADKAMCAAKRLAEKFAETPDDKTMGEIVAFWKPSLSGSPSA